MEPALNINSLPNEIILEIFRYLTHNELWQISRVCKKWNEYTKSPVLWKEVNVKFSWRNGLGNEVVLTFAEKLPYNVTHLKLDFGRGYWDDRLNFEEFCTTLNKKCPNLYRLILHHALFSVNLNLIISSCAKFLSNLKVLLLSNSSFTKFCKQSENDGHSKIEILGMSYCKDTERSIMNCISKMSCLKKLDLYFADVNDSWFLFLKDFSFLQKLEYLNLGWADTDYTTFRILQIHCRNLIELFLCRTDLEDDDFIFTDSFLLLKTICLRGCYNISCKGLISLVQSCRSLENIYVEADLAEANANHPLATESMLGIVKSIENCHHYKKLLKC